MVALGIFLIFFDAILGMANILLSFALGLTGDD